MGLDALGDSLGGKSPPIPYAEDDGDLWDRLVLGSYGLPGIWAVQGSASRRFDVKQRKGEDGATFRDHGYKVAELTLVGQFATADEWGFMVDALKDIHPRKKGALREPLAVEHPVMSYLGVTNVYVTEVFAPEVINGIMEVRISVLEWVKKPVKKKKPKDKPKASPEEMSAFGAVVGRDLNPLGKLIIPSGLSPSIDTPTYIAGPGFVVSP